MPSNRAASWRPSPQLSMPLCPPDSRRVSSNGALRGMTPTHSPGMAGRSDTEARLRNDMTAETDRVANGLSAVTVTMSATA
jgi:hypothetical protein